MNNRAKKAVREALTNYYRSIDNLHYMRRELSELEQRKELIPAVSAVDTTREKVTGGEQTSVEERFVIWLEGYPERKKDLEASIQVLERRILAIKATIDRYQDNQRANNILLFHFFYQQDPIEFRSNYPMPKKTFWSLRLEIMEYCYQQDREAFQKPDPWWQYVEPLQTEDVKTLQTMLMRVEPKDKNEKAMLERINRYTKR